MTCGIYIILNTINGKVYIGQSINVSDRLYQHKYKLNKNTHHNSHLQSSWNKYGEDSFEFNLLEPCPDYMLNDNESWWINYFNSTDPNKGYNYESGGNSHYIISEETRKKMSDAQKGEKSHCYGKKYPESHRSKISEAKKGDKNPMYGKKRPLDSLIKHSKTNNTTGYFRVHKSKDRCCKQGFIWVYQYRDGEVNHKFSSVDIEKLKEKVLNNGLEWIEF